MKLSTKAVCVGLPGAMQCHTTPMRLVHPKHSPDLSPIEQVFAKLKHLLRKAAERTTETVCQAIGELLEQFTSQECAKYFRKTGYEPT